MAISNKDLPRPIRRKKVIDVEGYGEFILRALSLTDRFALYAKAKAIKGDDYSCMMHWILHRSIVNPDESHFWSEDEWQDFGSTHDGGIVCARLFAEAMALFFDVEKKASTASSDSPSDSPSPSDEPSAN